MENKGQCEVFDFDIDEAEFRFGVEARGSVSDLTFTRMREGRPDDTLLVRVKSLWLHGIRDTLNAMGDRDSVPDGISGRKLARSLFVSMLGSAITRGIQTVLSEQLERNGDMDEERKAELLAEIEGELAGLNQYLHSLRRAKWINPEKIDRAIEEAAVKLFDLANDTPKVPAEPPNPEAEPQSLPESEIPAVRMMVLLQARDEVFASRRMKVYSAENPWSMAPGSFEYTAGLIVAAAKKLGLDDGSMNEAGEVMALSGYRVKAYHVWREEIKAKS